MNETTNNSNPLIKNDGKKKSSWGKYFILFSLILILGWVIFDACSVGYETIQPQLVFSQQVGGKEEITIQTKVDNKVFEYVVSGDNINQVIKNTSATYYFSNSNRIVWQMYVLAKRKISNGQFTKVSTISFKVTQFFDIQVVDGAQTTFSKHWMIGLHDTNTVSIPSVVGEWLNASTTSNATIPTTQTPIYIYLLQYAPQILFILIILWMMKKAMSGSGADGDSIFTIGKSQAKITTSSIKFSDVAGIREEKEELMEIVDYLKNPSRYAAMGARVPKGVILYGPPGTGKTLLAKAVSGEAAVPFFQVAGSSFDDMLVGSGAKRIRDLFTRARKVSPAIIFIDEIDSVAGKRGNNNIIGGGGGIADQTINQLLAEMDGFSTTSGIILIAATNRIDVLDEAILRPGRFDRHIQVNLPDIKEREEILYIHSRNKNISTKVNLTDIARRTPGMSGAQLENILNEATLLAVRKKRNTIQIDDIDEGIDRVIAGLAKRSRVLTEAERERVATHEAGHALVGLFTPGSDVVEKITIIPRGMAAGYTVSNPAKQESRLQTKKELLAMVSQLLGGRGAEECCYGKENVSTGAANDLYRVTNIVRSMVMQLGMSDLAMSQLVPSEGQTSPYSQKIYSEETAKKADQEVENIIRKQYNVVIDIINKNQKELKLIVDTLLTLETILRPQIEFIHKNLKLPPEVASTKKKTTNDEKKDEKKQD